MNQEFETQVLDIDKDEIIKKLRELGAKEEPEVMQKRWVFYTARATEERDEHVRLRQAGNKKPILTYKKQLGLCLHELRNAGLPGS